MLCVSRTVVGAIGARKECSPLRIRCIVLRVGHEDSFRLSWALQPIFLLLGALENELVDLAPAGAAAHAGQLPALLAQLIQLLLGNLAEGFSVILPPHAGRRLADEPRRYEHDGEQRDE